MFYVYLLHSTKDNGFYIGYSTNLKRRLSEHKRGASFATKSRDPWKLIYYEAYTEREDAEGREKFLKSGAGRRLKLGRFPHSLAASLAALPSMSLIPFAPFLRAQLRHYLRVKGFASVLKLVRYPHSLAPTLLALPSMSRVPRTPFIKTELPASLD
jgi:putative endonuclease